MDKDLPQLAFFIAVVSILIGMLVLLLVNLMLAARNRKLKHQSELVKMEAKIREEIDGIRMEVAEATLGDVSRDLHDEVGQLLTFGILQLENMHASPQEKQPNMLVEIKQSIREALDSVRSISRGLNPDFVNQQGLILSLQQLFERATSRTGVEAKINVLQGFSIINASHSIIIFRIIRECLTNAIRHGQATSVTLTLGDIGNMNTIRFEDNGTGFQTGSPSEGLGMKTMKHYASLMNSTLDYDGIPGKGTTISILFENKK